VTPGPQKHCTFKAVSNILLEGIVLYDSIPKTLTPRQRSPCLGTYMEEMETSLQVIAGLGLMHRKGSFTERHDDVPHFFSPQPMLWQEEG